MMGDETFVVYKHVYTYVDKSNVVSKGSKPHEDVWGI